jgi:hypothetical protein
MTSRRKRPSQPLPFQLTTRDRRVLHSVYRHRFLAAEHVHALHFPGSSQRACQVRLQRMWAGKLLDRLFLPPEVAVKRDRWTERPLYSLAAHGARIVAGDLNIDINDVPHTAVQNRRGNVRLRHNLAATDVLVAVEAFCAGTPPWAAATTREHTMAGKLHDARTSGRVALGAVLPDGAVTVTHPGLPVPQTYLIEIVRAGVKAGNATIARRFHRYRAALRSGYFSKTFGFAWVRAIVFLTPTMQRAKHLALLANGVPGGERLFRFGTYETRIGGGSPTSCWRADAVQEAQLLTPSGAAATLLPLVS